MEDYCENSTREGFRAISGNMDIEKMSGDMVKEMSETDRIEDVLF